MSASGGDLDRRIARALDRWLVPDAASIVLAVSGGPDSTALMHAAAALPRRRPIHVATVDHRLRPEAEAEAEGVAHAAAALGLPHTTLRWDGAKPASGIQAGARAARYRLLAEHAAAVGAGAVLTGHTRDDQAETVLMRLIAGSGPAGLAGMRPERPLAPGVILGRPFLGLPKADLIAWCEGRGLAYASDVSNADDRYGRVRLRRLMPRLARDGLTPDRLVRLAERTARDAAALDAAADHALAAAMRPASDADGRTVRFSPPASVGKGGPRVSEGRERGAPSPDSALPSPDPLRGLPSPAKGGGRRAGDPASLHLHGPTLTALPEAIALRVLDRALDHAGGTLPRRLERLERLVLDHLLPALRDGRPVRRTLRGLAIAADPAGRVTIRPAPPRRVTSLAAGGRDLLGKGKPAAYIGPECADGPAAAGTRPALPRD